MVQPGFSRWYLADLHVHTIADANHRYGTVVKGKDPDTTFAQDLMARFASAGITVVAVTDHNRVDWWPVLRDAGKKQGITLFPGIEISVNRCHLIGIWDANAPGFALAERFAASIHKPGQSPYVNGSPRPASNGNVEDNIRSIIDHGGLVVAPHSTNKSLGIFGPGVCSNSDELAQSGLISGFDVFGNPGSDVLQNPRSKFGEVSPRWILTGDTRAFEEIGQRAVHLKLGSKPTLEGLRQALLSPSTRVRFPEATRAEWGRVRGVSFASDSRPAWPRLERLTVKGGFHDGLDIQFGPGLNALIGGKGTGKSAIIEIVRHVVGAPQPPDASLIGNRARNFPANADGEVDYVGADGESYSIKRSGGTSPPQLFVRGVKTDVDVPRRVTVNVFGQRQLADLGASDALKEFLARSVGEKWTDLVESQRTVLRELEKNGNVLSTKETSLADLEDKAAERSDYSERVERARAAGADKVIAKLQELSKANQRNRRLVRWPAEIETALAAVRETLPAPPAPTTPAAMAKVSAQVRAAELAIVRALDDADTAVQSAAKAATIGDAAWRDHYDLQKAKLEGELADVGISNPSDLAAWHARLSELEEDLESLPSTKASHSALLKERDALLDRLRAGWRAKSRLIDEAARKVGDLLPPRVRIVSAPLGDRGAFRASLDRAVQGLGVRGDQLERLASLDPSSVIKAAAQGVDAVVALGVTANTASRIAALSPSVRRSLETAEIKDNIGVEMDTSPDGKGEWRSIDDVSPGQRATALLALVLVGGNEPLIIDQPEDDLDNRYIYEEVVGVLARTCERRQVIVATHNANIPILGDAELIVALNATATRSNVIAVGGLEVAEVADSARTILEGGEEAFKARSERYLGTRR